MTNESSRHLLKHFGHVAHPIFIFPTIDYAPSEIVNEKIYTQHTQRNPMHSFFIFPQSLNLYPARSNFQIIYFPNQATLERPREPTCRIVQKCDRNYNFYFPQIKSNFTRHTPEVVSVNK